VPALSSCSTPHSAQPPDKDTRGVMPERTSNAQPDTGTPSQEPIQPEATIVRSGQLVDLRKHTDANREAFIRWYADPEIATLLRHDLEPLTRREASAYFSNIIMPLSARGHCWAIHRHDTNQLVGTAAITDLSTIRNTCLFRIVIGEKENWGQGFGTEATRLAAAEVFDTLPVTRFRLEVFAHNTRARRAYERVGFQPYDRYEERVPAKRTVLDIIAMELTPSSLASNMPEHTTGTGTDSAESDAAGCR
jgi:RimJ/RimL family protein N-acetyltransferase